MRDPFRQKHPDAPKTRQDIEDELTEANVRKPFEEYPRFLYHPDGSLGVGNPITVQLNTEFESPRSCVIRSVLVKDEHEKSKAGPEWFPTPQLAVAERERRDARDRDKLVAEVNAEAAAKLGKPKN